ncbi:hypothetical protein [uncultured Dialister sp.]|uniref:hypothetical protein n=1 Tax=uncultured Dialister sp. TaxID=278064 RepID=UPI00259740A1|nr:hypothetical protein [uncultured Dialister sp.]
MDNTITVVINTILPQFISFLAGAAGVWFFRQRAMENAVKCLLRDRLIIAYNYHIKQGHSVQRDEYRSTLDMGEAYEKMSGKNGYIARILEEYRNAPLAGKEGEIL